MNKQALQNLLRFHLDVTLDEFCREVFPDFNPAESRGYLNGKFGQFQHRFFVFLSELDEIHLQHLANAVEQRYGDKKQEQNHHGH